MGGRRKTKNGQIVKRTKEGSTTVLAAAGEEPADARSSDVVQSLSPHTHYIPSQGISTNSG